MEKIIVKENKQLQDSAIYHLNQLILLLNKHIEAFKNTTFYCLTIDDIFRLMNNNRDAVEVMNEKLNLFLDGELDRQKITMPLMRSNFKTGYQGLVSGLSTELKKHAKHAGITHLGMLTMENGILVLTKENEEEIRDTFRNFLSSEKGKALLDLQKETCDKLQEFLTFIKEKTNLHFSSLPQLTNTFFYLDNVQGKVDIETNINYERIMK